MIQIDLYARNDAKMMLYFETQDLTHTSLASLLNVISEILVLAHLMPSLTVMKLTPKLKRKDQGMKLS